MTSKSHAFALDPTLDPEALAEDFRQLGRVEIPHFLDGDGAKRLRAHLQRRTDWVLVMNAGEKVFEIPRSRLGELSEPQRRKLDALVSSAARDHFQYRYESVRIADQEEERLRSGTLLDAFVRFMSSPPVLSLLGKLARIEPLAFADGQGTSYSAGHFLTRHDDAVDGKGRRAAYVLGLTPSWREEWGGLLMFHGPDGKVQEAFTPAMGALRLFSVPAVHSVSYVTPFAPEPRLSVTGWLRERPPQSSE